MEDIITRDSLNAQAYNRLCRDLKAGRFAPGEKLKLRDLAAVMGISPTPVREALARLISEQALEQMGHHSVRVPVMSEARFSEVRELRLMLEGQAAARAAELAGADDIKKLAAIHERMAALKEAGDTAGELLESERFHMAVYALAGMPILQRIVESLWLQCGPLMKALQTHALDDPRKQHPHHMVMRGLRKHDAEVARRGIHEEIERTAAPILVYLRERAAAVEQGPTNVRRIAGQLA
ncbi:GntR family transcriptional regulator [Acidovorax facilis]|jgi:DNA-binding GntR family transcriptional regulator|uniref:GntR family transcriptional regulator n=1 Tax=Acidovorax facilis TaxID=12917 RepID=UPI003D660A46